MPSSDARIRKETISIPTYPLGQAEANPMFFHGRGYQGAKGPMYPYPLLDRLSDEKVQNVLENPEVVDALEREIQTAFKAPEIGFSN